jgi:exonuclease SbcD
MKLFHTADWHLGKLIHGVYMTADQRYILEQFMEAVKEEQPDAVIIAGDLYDRAVPPTEAVELLDEILKKIVIDLDTPVLAIAGNHDSPDRLQFGSKLMEGQGLYLSGRLNEVIKPVIMRDSYGEVHFHLVPFADPSLARTILQDEDIKSHDDMNRAIISRIKKSMNSQARHVFIGHAFVTPGGGQADNTSDAERPLSIGGAEYVNAEYLQDFHYSALGHLHQAHHVKAESIRYSGSPLKYSISEEHHNKGFLIVDMDGEGKVQVEKRLLTPLRDMRSVELRIEDIENHEPSEDYVFVQLLNENPVLFPMEKIRAVYPNALHVERKIWKTASQQPLKNSNNRMEVDQVSLFAAFYQEVQGAALDHEKRKLFETVLERVLREEGERA